MSDWPPKPNNSGPQESNPNKSNEWKLLEEVVLFSIQEQRRARRWSIFFKCLSFAVTLLVLFGLFKGCSVSSSHTEKASSVSHLAVVDINGTISASSKDVNSHDTIKALRQAFEAKNSKAIALNINSPGGSPVESDNIWQEIRYLEQKYPNKKVYAVIGDMGASGAYYIASAANEIWVNPSSLVGSIGVIMPNYGVSGLAQKLGVEDRTMTSGENKDILSMTKPINAFQKEHIQSVLDNVHAHFIDAVKQGRGDRLKNADPKIFSGLFWTGEQAIHLGLADQAGNMTTLRRKLDLDKAVNYTVEYSPLESVLGKMGAEVGQGFSESVQQKLAAQQNIELK
ncbi:signal peptide peptidase SppA [Acinetobacter rathckeae]|uniref:signal peptide peptidase SppA n=1 Tax=Acinetobacter rathckeae TaxID=2605272 RepID=UPI0018A300EB|nr:signal peptide peptidase SppA [Acinetobacter rathckeae]MBF7687505.1 signal peptide peptidase SppA [Acinetobacter rathckeae]